MTEVSMVGIARLAGKPWVEKATASATTPLSKALTSIWLTDEWCGCTRLLAVMTVCFISTVLHIHALTDTIPEEKNTQLR